MWPGPRPTRKPSFILIHPAVWPQQTWAKNWAVPPFATFWGDWVPIWHNVTWAEVYLHTKWHLDPCSRLSTIDMGRKLWVLCLLFWEGELGPHLTRCDKGGGLPKFPLDPSNHLATIHQRHRQTGEKQTDIQTGQQSDSIGQTVFGRPFVKRFALCYRSVVCLSYLSVCL